MLGSGDQARSQVKMRRDLNDRHVLPQRPFLAGSRSGGRCAWQDVGGAQVRMQMLASRMARPRLHLRDVDPQSLEDVRLNESMNRPRPRGSRDRRGGSLQSPPDRMKSGQFDPVSSFFDRFEHAHRAADTGGPGRLGSTFPSRCTIRGWWRCEASSLRTRVEWTPVTTRGYLVPSDGGEWC